MDFGSPSPCSVCGGPRSRLEAAQGDICGALSCKAAVAKQRARTASDLFDDRCNAVVALFAQRHAKPGMIVARVPYLDRPIVETPEAQKIAFRKTLRENLRATFRAASEGAPAHLLPEANEATPPTLDASCIACRGFCCRQGAGHAFLQPGYLPTVLNRRPKDSIATIYRDYASRIPKRAAKDSCLYQGAQGCVLPRIMRSWICNAFECKDRKRLRTDLERNPRAAALVVAMDQGTIRASLAAEPGQPMVPIKD